MGYVDYRDYLLSDHWRGVRDTARDEITYVCLCGATDALDLHHVSYERVGREQIEDLAWLCHHCHAMVHALELRGDSDLAMSGLADAARAEITGAARYATSTRQAEMFAELHHEDLFRRRARSLANRLRQVAIECERDGLDYGSELEAIEHQVNAIAQRRAASP